MRIEFASTLLKLKQAIREQFPSELPPMHEKLLKYEKWYKPASHEKYYRLIKQWIETPDNLPPYGTCIQVRCAPSNAWLEDVKGVGAKPTAQLSIQHLHGYAVYFVRDL